MKEKIVFTDNVGAAVDTQLAEMGNPQVAVLVDVNTDRFVLPLLRESSKAISGAPSIVMLSGEGGKSLDELKKVWRRLDCIGATRNTVLINAGGGVVTDLGGFAAATYKRGMPFINVPTTVLGAVDASFGGKTGINFNGAKNQIGVFAHPAATIISDIYFRTLNKRDILSGYAEMIKHALLDSQSVLDALLSFSPLDNDGRMLELIRKSTAVKQRVVEADPKETGLRKILNLGHTAGHAFEGLAYRRGNPVPHGYAVAWGLTVALVLSHMQLGFPSDTLHKVAGYVRDNYGAPDIDCNDYDELIAFMKKDKKNVSANAIAFTLMVQTGQPRTDCITEPEQIKAALDIFRDLSGTA